jgi:hypothetical protein
MASGHNHHMHHAARRAEVYRQRDPLFAEWATGYGVIDHDLNTQVRIYEIFSFSAEYLTGKRTPTGS